MSTGQKILVADDSLTIRKLVETVLTQDGYEVITAESGEECLTMAAAKKPGLILLDYILPDMQGTEICRRLINSSDTWEIPILMMSSNGNAIRQLYQDLNNVADYLTKPFAPNVLKAVVGHLLQREKATGESAATPPAPSSAATAAPAGAPEPAVPKEFLEKVNRLLNLMEGGSTPAEPSPAAGAPSAPATAAPPAKKRRTRKAVTSAPAPDSLLRKFRLALQKQFRPRMRQIPDWETARGTEEAESYFLGRLLAKDALWELSADLVRATGLPAEAPGALRCPSSLVPLDALLRHLHTNRATGELRVETDDETVLVCLEEGEAVLLTTNHPRNYCAGAACDFQAVPHTVIGEAVRAQEEQSLPFFLTLQIEGHLPPGAVLGELLTAQGEKCLARAFAAREAVATFLPLERLPAVVRAHRLDLPLSRLLLVCYRTVDDWFTLEKVVPEMDAVMVPTPELKTHVGELGLDAAETQIIEAAQSGRTVAELAEATALKPFEVCRVLYRFLRLGFLRQGLRRGPDARVDDDLPAAVKPVPEGSSVGDTTGEVPAVRPDSPTEPGDLPGTVTSDAPVIIAGDAAPAVVRPSVAVAAALIEPAPPRGTESTEPAVVVAAVAAPAPTTPASVSTPWVATGTGCISPIFSTGSAGGSDSTPAIHTSINTTEPVASLSSQ